jgi:hypothetical protein
MRFGGDGCLLRLTASLLLAHHSRFIGNNVRSRIVPMCFLTAAGFA